MSLGYGGKAVLSDEDCMYTTYKYGAYNWDLGQDINNMNMDGIIKIYNNCFYEPDIHIKTNKKHKGKKVTEKRIPKDVPYEQYINNGQIKVINCQNTWEYWNQTDIVAIRLIRKILINYQEEG